MSFQMDTRRILKGTLAFLIMTFYPIGLTITSGQPASHDPMILIIWLTIIFMQLLTAIYEVILIIKYGY
jgi:cellulose synthase/poly-beta-1,6-N-acetylglucosamine synthase-like glycosyltransferase